MKNILRLRKKKCYNYITILLFLYYKEINSIDFFCGNNKIYMKILQKNKNNSSIKKNKNKKINHIK